MTDQLTILSRQTFKWNVVLAFQGHVCNGPVARTTVFKTRGCHHLKEDPSVGEANALTSGKGRGR